MIRTKAQESRQLHQVLQQVKGNLKKKGQTIGGKKQEDGGKQSRKKMEGNSSSSLVWWIQKAKEVEKMRSKSKLKNMYCWDQNLSTWICMITSVDVFFCDDMKSTEITKILFFPKYILITCLCKHQFMYWYIPASTSKVHVCLL